MRALVLGLALWLAPLAASAQLVRVQPPTEVAFAASDENGMLVTAQHAGATYAPGRYRFVRIDRETERALEPVDLVMGRTPVLGGTLRPDALLVTTTFHYAIVPAGEYAFVWHDSSANNTVTETTRSTCLAPEAPIYVVAAGAVTIVRVPDRIPYDIFRDNGFVRRPFLRRFPAGTTMEDLYTPEKAALDFDEIRAVNPQLTAPHAFVAPIGALTFETPRRPERDQCLPGEGFAVTLAPAPAHH